jgi:chemotaxis signal transduction protein
MVTSAHQPYLTFRLGDAHYAIAIDSVVEVQAMVAHQPLHHTNPALLGMINRHGQAVPLIDLRRSLHGTSVMIQPDTLFIVLHHNPYRGDNTKDENTTPIIEQVDAHRQYAVVVDEIFQVVYWSQDDLQVAPADSDVMAVTVQQDKLVQILHMEMLWRKLQTGGLLAK